MTTADAVRLCASLAQCEIALVRRDPVAGPLLAQAARHAAGLPPGELVAAAAALLRAAPSAAGDPAADAARKVAQALCRRAVIMVDAALIGGAA
ncbi:MAG: hypothetical protein AB7V62_00445 [Thermoleophilia bacterium]